MKRGIIKKLLCVTAAVGLIFSMACNSMAATTIYFNLYRNSKAGTDNRLTSTSSIDGTSFNYTAYCTNSTNGAGIRFTIEDGSYSTLLFSGQSYSLSRTKKNASGNCWVQGDLYYPNSTGTAQGYVTKN